MRALLLQIGETLSVWSRPAAAAVAAAVADPPGVSTCYPPRLMSKESLSSSEQAFALAGAHVGLLRALLAKEGWSAPLATCLREVSLVEQILAVSLVFSWMRIFQTACAATRFFVLISRCFGALCRR